MYIYIHIYIYMVTPPPHDRPSPLKHRPHRRIRAFPEVSSFSPDFVCPEPHPSQNQKTKTSKVSRRMRGQFCCFFGFLDFWFFGFLVFWFLDQKSKNPKNQNSKSPKIQKSKTVPTFSVKLWIFGFLVLGASLFQSRPLPLYK